MRQLPRFTSAPLILILGLILPPLLAAQNVIVDPASLVFTYRRGSPPPNPQTIGVILDTAESQPYTAQAGNAVWMSLSKTSGSTPDTLSVSVNPVALDPGIYADSVLIRSGNSSWAVPITLYVQDVVSDFIVGPGRLFFEALPAGPEPPAQVVSVSAFPGVQKQFWVATSGDDWLLAGPASALTPSSVEVRVFHQHLLPGTYNGSINIFNTEGRFVFSVMVTLVVAPHSPITATPGSLTFQAESGVDAPQSRNVVISNVTGESHLFETTARTDSGGNWLSVSPEAGITPMVIAVTIDAANLPVGVYTGTAIVNVLNTTVRIPVTLNVTDGPVLVVSPAELRFESSEGVAPAPQPLAVDSYGGAQIPFVVTTQNADWVTVEPMSGTTLTTLTVSARPAGLAPGAHSGLILITAQGSTTPVTAPVTFEITGAVTLLANPAALSFTKTAGSAGVLSKSFSVSSSGPSLSFTARVPSTPWLTVTQSSGTTPAQVEATISPAGLASGIHYGLIVITSTPAGNSPLSIPVTLAIEEEVPNVAAVVHAASLKSGAFAPGVAVTLFGSFLGPETGVGLELGPDGRVKKELAGVQALFNGIPGALIYVQGRQINAIVPFAVAGRSEVSVVVRYRGEESEPVPLLIAEAAPGLFTVNSSGQGPGAILNENQSLNSSANRAARNSVISVYGTGAGLMSPPADDGEVVGGEIPIPVLPVRAWVGDQDARVEFAGGAPGLVAGVLQVNIRVPASLAPGIHPIKIAVGEYVSQLGVSVAVE